jgi:hypothetical protein
MTEVSIGYHDSPLCGPHPGHLPGPGPGERMPPDAAQPPIGSGNTPRFALCAEPCEGINGLLQQFDALLDPQLRPPPAADGIWLVRPDGYVACVASREHCDAIGDFLKSRVG